MIIVNDHDAPASAAGVDSIGTDLRGAAGPRRLGPAVTKAAWASAAESPGPRRRRALDSE